MLRDVMTTRKDLEGFTQGAYVERTLEWQDINGVVVPITGRTFASQLRYSPADPVSYAFAVTVDGPAGRVVLTLTKALSETLPAGLLWWDLKETTVGAQPDVIFSGRVAVRRRVTR